MDASCRYTRTQSSQSPPTFWGDDQRSAAATQEGIEGLSVVSRFDYNDLVSGQAGSDKLAVDGSESSYPAPCLEVLEHCLEHRQACLYQAGRELRSRPAAAGDELVDENLWR